MRIIVLPNPASAAQFWVEIEFSWSRLGSRIGPRWLKVFDDPGGESGVIASSGGTLLLAESVNDLDRV